MFWSKKWKLYTYLNKCVQNCPNEFISEQNNICIQNETIFISDKDIENDIDNLEITNNIDSIINEGLNNNINISNCSSGF